MKKSILTAVVMIALCTGCARSIIMLDKPDYHYQNGLRLFNQGNIDGAKIEFEYAIFLDEGYAPAYVGLAIAYGTMGDLDNAVANMKRAQELYHQNYDGVRTDNR